VATSDSSPQPEIPGELPEIDGEVLADIVGDKPAEPEGAESSQRPMISFSHVSLWFDERRVLDNVSFVVHRGETLCILGRSGVGSPLLYES